MSNELVYLGGAALMLGCAYHHLYRLCCRGEIPFMQLGHQRVIRVADLPTVREKCAEWGYLKPTVQAGK